MKTTLLTTVGLTSYYKIGINRGDQRNISFIQQQLTAYLLNIQSTDPSMWKKDEWENFPAEVGAASRIIEKLNLHKKNVHIVLIATDTNEGKICAEIVQDIFKHLGYLPEQVEIKNIPGFQSDDAALLLNKGIPAFIDVVDSYIDDRAQQVFSISGGFKSFIPFVTQIASFYRRDMFYVFESAVSVGVEGLVHIPKVPTLNRMFMTESSNAEVILQVLEDIEEFKFNDANYALDYVEKELTNRLIDVSEHEVEEYSYFIEDFIHANEQPIQLNIMGTMYLKILHNRLVRLKDGVENKKEAKYDSCGLIYQISSKVLL